MNYNRYELDSRSSCIDDRMEKIAYHEISRILNILNIPDMYKNLIFKKFKNIWPQMIGENIYCDPETLIPLIIYLFFRSLNIPISSERLIESSKITKHDFYCFL